MTEPEPSPLVASLRASAATSVAAATAAAEALLAQGSDDPDLVYLLAELRARAGRSLEALDLIDVAEQRYRALGRDADAERCEIGRVTVLDDLGRHEDALAAATRQVDRLVALFAAGSGAHGDLLVRARSNRGLCLETAGRYEEAAREYDLAMATARSIGDQLLAAQLQINRSNVLNLLGRSTEAVEALRDALTVLEELGEREDRVKAAANLGSTLCRRGEFDDGLSWLRRAEELVEPHTDDECGIEVEIGDALIALGAVEEAAERYRRALRTLEDAPMSWLEGRAWMGLGSAAAVLGDHAQARRAFRAAIDAFEVSDNLPWRVWALLEWVRVDRADDETPGLLALEQARRTVAMVDTTRWPVQALLAHLRLAELSEGDAIERHLREARRIGESLALPPLSFRVEQRLGAYLLGRGRVDDAAPHVTAAVEWAESMRGRLHHFGLLRTFPAETSDAYNDLIELELARGHVEGAFDAVDRARSRSLLDVGGGVLTPGGRSDAAVRLEAELHAVYDRLMGLDDRPTPEVRAQLDRRARDIERELERLDLDLGRWWLPAPSASAGAEAGVPRPPGAVLVYHVRRSRIGVFVRVDDRLEWLADLGAVDQVAAELERLHAEGRRAHALRLSGFALPRQVQAACDSRLARLGEALLGPVWSSLVSGDPAAAVPVITVVPTGVLHGIPFHALRLGDRSVIEDAATVVAPSLAVQQRCASRSVRTHGRRVVVGLAEGGVDGVLREVERIGAVLGDATVLTGERATLDAVAAAAQGASLVHLASHGMFRAAAPLQSGVRLADGWLTARRAAGIDLHGALVVLSACDTGRSVVTCGEELLGLQYGFLAAGARAIVVSLWPAHDGITPDLMTSFHRRVVAGVPPAHALRSAQLEIREREPHPWWWAPFVLSGAPG